MKPEITQSIVDSLQPGDCILIGGKSFVSRGIKWFTNSKYSHTALYLGGGSNYVAEATAVGVEKNKIQNLLAYAECVCVRRIPNLTVEQAEIMKDKAYSLIYDSYDTLQFISYIPYFLFRKVGINLPFLVFNSRQKMVCSELYAVCALAADIRLYKSVKLITPEFLYKTNKLITIIEEELV
jgi:hypothetical protein